MRHLGEKDVIMYTLPSGKKPVREWLDNMKDAVARLRLITFIPCGARLLWRL
jgi:hypothetical protein